VADGVVEVADEEAEYDFFQTRCVVSAWRAGPPAGASARMVHFLLLKQQNAPTMMPSDAPQAQVDAPDPQSREGRAALARMVTTLFDHWQLSTADQAALLGLSEASRSSLARYRRGDPLADSRDLVDRAGHLLAIHRSLRILFPQNRALAYRWPTVPNTEFGGRTPVQVMREEGFLGLLTVRRYLDFERGG
jgi:hypothetical protein